MSTFKKLLALTLALAMVLSVSAFAGYKADTYKDAASIDEDCESAIELMYALDIMTGDANGNFNPTATITRAEIVKMIYVILNSGNDDKAVNYKGANVFTDVPAGAWYEGYVTYAYMHKLVNGRGNGTFGPNDPVTTAEAAKMLLTAIGYSSEARGYTGANWAFNVLSDARILGLLDGYNFSTTGYAPRQWVAVMVENALGCYTFDTMRPTFSGLLVSGEAEVAHDTMGRKYFDLETTKAYLIATDSVYIDQLITCDKDHKHDDKCARTTTADDDCLLFSDGTVIESDELGYMDLGQKFRVIYDYDDNDVVYSIRPITSDVADSIIMDVEVDNTYATDKNDAKNKYEFTIGDMTAKFNSYTIKALIVSDKVATATWNFNADELKAYAGSEASDLVRAIDKDDDGDIDYLIVVKYTYGAVNKIGEHQHYGEYFTAKTVIGTAYKPAGYTGDKWYLDDVVNTEDEIVKGNYIKVNYNPDNSKYDVEVLPVAEEVTYEKRTSKGVHTLGGEEYVVADNGFEAVANEKALIAGNLKETMDLVYDGTLAVYAELCDSDYTDLADINAQLVMVTDLVIDEYTLGGDRAYIDYMTIDGELHEEVRYVDGKDTSKTDDDANVNVGELEIHLANHMRLFVLVESGDSVYLKKLTPDAWVKTDNSQAILDYSSSLLSGYTEEDGTLDTEDNEFEEDFVANENKFFVSYLSKGVEKFAVMSLDDMGEGEGWAFAQALYKTKREFDTYLAGYFYLPNLVLDKAAGYLYSTTGDVYLDDSEGDYVLTDVFFNDGAEEGVEIFVTNPSVDANRLYSYTYEKVNGEKVYTLTLVNDRDTETQTDVRIDVTYGENNFSELKDDVAFSDYELINAYVADNGDEIVVANHKSVGREYLEMASSYDIVLKKVVLDRDENQNELTDDDLYFSIDTEIAFTTFADLIAEDEDGVSLNRIYNGESDDTYEYYSDYRYVLNDSGNVKMLYVITYAVEVEAQIG